MPRICPTPRRILPIALVVCIAGVHLSSEENWTEFRGPGGQGHAGATGLPLQWSETKNVRWKTELPGRGWSSPVIEDGQLWMTAAVESPVSSEERERRLDGNTGSQPLSVSGEMLGRDQYYRRYLHLELPLPWRPRPQGTVSGLWYGRECGRNRRLPGKPRRLRLIHKM